MANVGVVKLKLAQKLDNLLGKEISQLYEYFCKIALTYIQSILSIFIANHIREITYLNELRRLESYYLILQQFCYGQKNRTN